MKKERRMRGRKRKWKEDEEGVRRGVGKRRKKKETGKKIKKG